MKNSPSQAAAAELRTYALSFPESNEEFPWGESAFKVKGKVFLFMRAHEEGVGMSMKLPQSNAAALDKGFAQPTGYGLGKSGWVSCTFEGSERVPVDLIKEWILESWRAVAPKTLVRRFDGGGVAGRSESSSTLSRKAGAGAPRKNNKPQTAKSPTQAGTHLEKTARKAGKSTKGTARKSSTAATGAQQKSAKSVTGTARKSAAQRARKRS